MKSAVFLCALSLAPCWAKEAVYLKTGFSLEVDSHTQQDETLIVQIGSGSMEFPANQIDRIEVLPAESPLAHPQDISSIEIESPEEILNHAAYLQGIDEEFVRSVAKVESGLRQDAVSRKGAIGLMQLMPSTAVELGVHPDQAVDNAKGGAKYLRALLVRYGGNSALALAAYNAGPEAVTKYGGIPPYAETRRYVVSVLREYQRELKAKKAVNTPSATN